MRLFVAIELPETWKAALEDLQSRMQEALRADPDLAAQRVRWVRTEGIHLTLKFLGGVSQERLEPTLTALEAAIPHAPGFELSMTRAGAFNDRHAPRVIWATVEVRPEAKPLLQLVESIETWLAASGYARKRRSFAPHLTLARLPDDIDPAWRQRIAALTTAVPMPEAPPCAVESVSLMRSYLEPGGARYERIAEFPA